VGLGAVALGATGVGVVADIAGAEGVVFYAGVTAATAGTGATAIDAAYCLKPLAQSSPNDTEACEAAAVNAASLGFGGTALAASSLTRLAAELSALGIGGEAEALDSLALALADLSPEVRGDHSGVTPLPASVYAKGPKAITNWEKNCAV
jgi:hypothetical protein